MIKSKICKRFILQAISNWRPTIKAIVLKISFLVKNTKFWHFKRMKKITTNSCKILYFKRLKWLLRIWSYSNQSSKTSATKKVMVSNMAWRSNIKKKSQLLSSEWFKSWWTRKYTSKNLNKKSKNIKVKDWNGLDQEASKKKSMIKSSKLRKESNEFYRTNNKSNLIQKTWSVLNASSTTSTMCYKPWSY